MTKAHLIKEVSRAVEITHPESEVIVDIIFNGMAKALLSGDKVEIRGFSTFYTYERGPRIGRNPKTGVRVNVPAKRIAHFRPGGPLKEGVNRSAEYGQEVAPA